MLRFALSLACVAAANIANIATDEDWALTDVSGNYSKLTVSKDGKLAVNTVKYPPIAGLRTKESDSLAEETEYASVTKSSFAAIRVSTKYTQAQFKRGFGSDVSFDTVDKDSKYQELGVIGFAHTGDGNATADFVIKSWCVH